jgi:mRNA-degrading endonuclease RelE of RelBE toxin-antitoxin system
MQFKTSSEFDKDVKRLSKKYRHIKDDLIEFMASFENEHLHATTIRKNIFKARIKNSDKAKGKSGGYRTYYYTITDESVTFLILYDKSETEKIDETVLDNIIAEIE